MERVEGMLFEAAAKGSVNSLQKILKEDALILDRVTINYLSETPLHVASMLGHVDFVKEIIKIKPQLTSELNLVHSSPLHQASAKGHVEVVRALMPANPAVSLVRDSNGLMPLHLAAIKGHVDVINELLLDHKKPNHDAARVSVYRGENVLHLCVRHHQLEALKLLVKTINDPGFVNSKDADGNTILHMAVAYRQVETIKFLLTVAAIEVNALNLNGMTAMDILFQSRRVDDMRDLEIEECLKHAGGFGTMAPNTTPLQMITQTSLTPTLSPAPHYLIKSSAGTKHKNDLERLLKRQDDWLERKKGTLMIVASLIATMAFQVGVNPPSGVWQDDNLVDSQGNPVPNPHRAGLSVLATKNPIAYTRFYIVNTLGFIASLSIILLLISGLPIRKRFFMWILMVITWIAITAIALTYTDSIILLTPTDQFKTSLAAVVGWAVIVWVLLMALLLVGHTIRLMFRLIKKVYRMLTPRKKFRSSMNP